MNRASIKDVAKHAKVSIATVSNVINGTGRVSSETIRRVKGIIEELKFSPNLSARSLKDKRSHLIAVIVPYLVKGSLQDNPFYWGLVRGIEESAGNHKFQVILQGVSEDETFSFVHDRNLDGLIVVGILESSTIYKRIVSLGVPCVFVDSYLSDPEAYEVGLADDEGGYLGTRHLLDLGHRRIGIITGELWSGGVTERRHLGYRKALDEAGIAHDPDIVFQGPNSMLGGYRMAAEANRMDNEITAFFAFSDILAMGFIKGLHDAGRSIPQEISVVGFDDLYFSSFLTPTLTTIRQDLLEKGRMALRLLLDQINQTPSAQSKKIVLPVAIQIRNSTAHYRR